MSISFLLNKPKILNFNLAWKAGEWKQKLSRDMTYCSKYCGIDVDNEILMRSEFQEADVIASKSNIKLGLKFCEIFILGRAVDQGFI